MIAITARTAYASVLLAGVLMSSNAAAVDAIVVGDVVVDTPTLCCLGFSVPVSDDDDYDAVATIEYRLAGSAGWSNGLSLLRVRPELTSEESPPGRYGLPVPEPQFAGSLFELAPGTAYEVRISVSDPDGGDRVQTLTVSTARGPRADPQVPRYVAVNNDTQLNNAIQNAQAGDVIQLAAGTYGGPLTVNANGTADNPIILRGASAGSVTIDASGAQNGVSIWGRHIYLEHVTVTGSTWGVRSYDTEGTVIRHSRIVGVNRGIDAGAGVTRGFYICDNVLEGVFNWPNISSQTWNEEGIAIAGEGHTVCHNTLSGFGDALSLSNRTSIPNVAIDIYGNDVLWTSDDGLELDFAHRNVRAFRNRATNVSMGASLQPAWGGPVYIFRNVFLNIASSAYKLNNNPSGFYILHNTSARTLGAGNWGDYAWTSLGYMFNGEPAYAGNFQMKNNIFIGLGDPAYVTTALILEDIDSNGWAPDGAFRFVNTWVNFADLQSNSPYEANGRILGNQTFATALVLPADYTTFWTATDVRLEQNSDAIDGAQPLANINDSFNGSAPDLGAVEFGDALPVYGARQAADTLAPAAPTNVRVE